MPVLHRYLLGLFLGGFLKVLGVFLGLFFLFDGMEQIRRFASHPHAESADLALYLLLRLPAFLTELLPAVTLLATIAVLGQLRRHNEITAMRASGLSIYTILTPFMLGGVLIAGLHLLLQDQLLPWSQARGELLDHRLKGETPPQADPNREVWFRDGLNLVVGRRIIPGEPPTLEGITVFRFAPGQRLVGRLDAQRAVFQGGGWWLEEGTLYQFEPEPAATPFSRQRWETTLAPHQLNGWETPVEQLSSTALWREAERLEGQGYDPTEAWMTLYRRLASPFTTLTAILLAFPFSLRLQRMGGVAREMGLGVATGFALFLLVDLATALGMGGRLPPLLAAVAPAMIFGGIGGFLLIHLEEATTPPRAVPVGETPPPAVPPVGGE